FATLDPTMRGVALPTGRKVILSDTVGFISDLPTQLVAAFRATLEEVLEADLILHVRDIAHPETAEQAADVAEILESLGVGADVPLIEVRNKIDLLAASARPSRVGACGAPPPGNRSDRCVRSPARGSMACWRPWTQRCPKNGSR